MTIRARDGNGRAIRSAETIRQDIRAAELRSQSLSIRAVATELGIAPSTAHLAIERGFREIPREDAEAARDAMAEQLDHVAKGLRETFDTDETQKIAAGKALTSTIATRSRILGHDAMTEEQRARLKLDERQADLNEQLGHMLGAFLEAVLEDAGWGLDPETKQRGRVVIHEHLKALPSAG